MSIKINFPGQTSIVYPPEPGTPNGPCVEPCSHLDCIHMRHDAEMLCPVCQQPLGFGGTMRIVETTLIANGKLIKTGGGRLTMTHAACYGAIPAQPSEETNNA